MLSGIFARAVASHCNASNLVLEILKHGKIREGQFVLASPTPTSDLRLCEYAAVK